VPGRDEWWRNAACYEVYLRSFADSDGDGLGDLPGLRSRLPYLHDLGIDAIWITPFYPSPQVDHGYDVADYRDVDRRFGTLADFDGLLEEAHELGLRVIIDLVPNHTSAQHAHFRAALATGSGSAERQRYHFRPGAGRAGIRPPNNWRSAFGGPAWTRVTGAEGQPAEWYLHLHHPGQPDLNWANPAVGAEFESILRFWLDRGVDGLRIDVAMSLAKDPGFPDLRRGDDQHPYHNRPEVHSIYRRWRTVLDSYPGDRMMIAEAVAPEASELARYVSAGECHQVFNFAWLETRWSAAEFGRVIKDTLDSVRAVDASPTWVLASHDAVRTVSRYSAAGRAGEAVGLERARAALLVMLSLPGSAYVFQGEELGLPQVDVPPAARRDPRWFQSGGSMPGRDGSRVPIPWTTGAPSYGFSPAGSSPPWLPQPASWGELSVATQERNPASTLAFYRKALQLRRTRLAGLDDGVVILPSAPGTLVLARDTGFVCALNCGSRPARPPAGELILSSTDWPDSLLPPNSAAWFQLSAPPRPNRGRPAEGHVEPKGGSKAGAHPESQTGRC